MPCLLFHWSRGNTLTAGPHCLKQQAKAISIDTKQFYTHCKKLKLYTP